MTKLLKTIAPQGSRFAALTEVLRLMLGARNIHRAWRERNVTARELARLGDMQLKDIGLHRSEIGAVLRDAESRRRCRRP